MPVQSGVLLCLKMHCCRHVQKLSSRMIFCLKFFHVTHRIRLSNSSHCCSLEVITELQRAIKDQIHPSHDDRAMHSPSCQVLLLHEETLGIPYEQPRAAGP